MSYLFWDDFFLQWQNGGKSIGGWSDPDGIPLFNDPGNTQLSSQFIPEPWWGNDGSVPLHSVVVNYNPGKGEWTQMKGQIPTVSSYADGIVLSGLLPKTSCWHCNHRAMPILSSLRRLKCISGPVSINSHLSLELIPWHMKGVNDSYWKYVSQNALAIFNNTFCFAASESCRISNDKLKSTVLIRMREESIMRLLKEFRAVKVQSEIVLPRKTTLSGKAFFLEFRFDSLPNNRFVSLWGSQVRNNLPRPNDLDEILRSL